MVQMIWKTCSIEHHLDEIKELFSQNSAHKHADNYLKEPLFEYTKFARLGFAPNLVYYSAGVERPEYNGSIRIMTRHTRSRNHDFGSRKDDLIRGVETLDILAEESLNKGLSVFELLGFIAIACSLLLFVIGKPIKKWMHGIN